MTSGISGTDAEMEDIISPPWGLDLEVGRRAQGVALGFCISPLRG